jgi:predicted permease
MFRQNIRALARAPAFSVVAMLSLGLAIAVNTTLYAFIDTLVHPYAPYAESDRVFTIHSMGADRAHPLLESERQQAVTDGTQAAEQKGLFFTWSSMVAIGDHAEDRVVVAGTPNLFRVLGVRPLVGRSIEGRHDFESGAVISYALWTAWYQRRPLDTLTIAVGSARYNVVGVMPPGVHFPQSTSVWLAISDANTEIRSKSLASSAVIRMRPGGSPAAIRRDVNRAFERLAQSHGGVAMSAMVVPLRGSNIPLSAYVLTMGTGALVLLIACANLGTMLLARGVARRRQVAIRVALGASRRAIIADVLRECSLLAVGGLAVGLLLTYWSMHALPHWVSSQAPQLGDIARSPSGRVVGFACALGIAIVGVAGSLPALRASRSDPASALKDGMQGTERSRDRYNPLLIVEVALSNGLLTTACLFAFAAHSLVNFHFSYYADRLIVSRLEAPGADMPVETLEQFFSDALTRLKGLRGVEEVASRSVITPEKRVIVAENGLSGNRWINLSQVTMVSPEYLRTLGVAIEQGRDFEAGDRDVSHGVAIVDEMAARQLWPNATPVGRQLKLGPAESSQPWLRVVGVARRTEIGPRNDPDLPPEPDVYFVRSDASIRERQVVVRMGSGDPKQLTRMEMSIGRKLQELSPSAGSPRVNKWLEAYHNSVTRTTFLAFTFATFGAFGLGLCALGFFGATAYTVNRRTSEFALRVTLGAKPIDLVFIVLHDAAVVVLAGLGVGALATLWVMRTARDAVLNAGVHLAAAVAISEAVLIIVACGACFWPLIRAVRVNPSDALRAR